MSPPLKNYLKTHRKTAGLSQNDVAFLLGKESGSYVSRVEQNKMNPDLCSLISYQILFNAPVEEILAGVYYEVELQIFNRIAKLITLLEKKGRNPKILRRINYLEEVERKIAEYNNQES